MYKGALKRPSQNLTCLELKTEAVILEAKGSDPPADFGEPHRQETTGTPPWDTDAVKNHFRVLPLAFHTRGVSAHQIQELCPRSSHTGPSLPHQQVGISPNPWRLHSKPCQNPALPINRLEPLHKAGSGSEPGPGLACLAMYPWWSTHHNRKTLAVYTEGNSRAYSAVNQTGL